MKTKRKSNREIIRELKEKLAEREQACSKLVDECAALADQLKSESTLPISEIIKPNTGSINPKIKEALEYYSNQENWRIRGAYKRYRNVEQDHGRKAQEALAVINA